ncbi:acyl-CoA dehydrogenase, partial [Planctomycetota bacterium]
AKLREDDLGRVWYADFLAFVAREKLFATMLTPPDLGDDDARWDTWRNCELNEILGFYGLCYWYTWQVTILGLGPFWMSGNEALRRRAAERLSEGGIFAFGLSEREHGADIYATGMTLSPQEDGTYLASGRKYYIGNGNEAAVVSVFGKIEGTDEYVFFAAEPRHECYELIKNVVASQSYVAEFALNDYPVTEADILSRGQPAWDAMLNTVNVGKYNLGWASIGICTHALYEAMHHAAHRRLYNMPVTDFPHVQRMCTDAYARLVAMKLFALRAADYLRSASPDDRRYLLYNPVVKMKVTTQGEKVIDLLWDVIAAKGFEKDTYFEMATRDIRALPKLEGTVHVNVALIVKFMASYFFGRDEGFPEVPRRDDATHDAFLFDQGRTGGLSGVRFHDYDAVFGAHDLRNVNIFRRQVGVLKLLLETKTPTQEQRRDTDFVFALGELFAHAVYGHLILENAKLYEIGDDMIEQIFDFLVRDFSKFAQRLHAKATTTPGQAKLCLPTIVRPVVDRERTERIWREHVLPLAEAYEMNS